MNKFSLSKQKILILAISAIVVIGGAVAAVAIFRNSDKAKEDTTTSATVQQYDYEEQTYYADVPVFVTDEDNSTVTDPSGNALTTIKRVVQTTKKAANKGTTKKPAATQKPNGGTAQTTKKTQGNTGLVQDVLEDGAFAGYQYDAAGDFYYTDDKDCWQKNAGYNEIYDNLAPATAMFIDQIRIRFSYGGKDWMIQYWKGQYGLVLVGAEIGTYNRPAGSSMSTHYDCATDDMKMLQSMDIYRRESESSNKFKYLFSRSPAFTWWCAGFVPGTLGAGQYNVDAEATGMLKVDSKLTLHSPEMAQAFMQGLREVKTIEYNGATKQKRPITMKEYATVAEYESATGVSSKFCLEEDGVTVRVCWR